MALTAAAASGLPAKVDECSIGSSSSGRNTSSVARTAPTGTTPPDRILPDSRMSGTTSSMSAAHHAPTRPSPVWISSRISSAPVRVHSSRTAASQPAGGTRTPPSPRIGSSQHAGAFAVGGQPARQVVDVTERGELDPGQQRLERRPVGGPAGDAQRAERLAVEAVPHRDDPGAAVQPGQLERDLDGLGARVGQVDVVEPGRRDAGPARPRRIGCHPADQRFADQRRGVELPLDRVDDDRVAVADQIDPEPGAVQVADAVGVVEWLPSARSGNGAPSNSTRAADDLFTCRRYRSRAARRSVVAATSGHRLDGRGFLGLSMPEVQTVPDRGREVGRWVWRPPRPARPANSGTAPPWRRSPRTGPSVNSPPFASSGAGPRGRPARSAGDRCPGRRSAACRSECHGQNECAHKHDRPFRRGSMRGNRR